MLDKELFILKIIFSLPVVLPLLILIFQYLVLSFRIIKVNNNEICFTRNTFIPINEILNIEKFQSMKHDKGNDYAYLPWMAGTFYYYKINLKSGKRYYLTCLMDNKRQPFEEIIKKYTIEYKVINQFYPLILT